MILMPLGANIPPWARADGDGKLLLDVPSWSREVPFYTVVLNEHTRELFGPCKGYQFRGGCHHVRGLKWFCSKPHHHGPKDTSLEAFRAFSDEQLEGKRKTVWEKLREIGASTDKQIAKALGWPINCEVPRRNECVQIGRIVEKGIITDPDTNRAVTLWEAVF